jgi:hypothetical protein
VPLTNHQIALFVDAICKTFNEASLVQFVKVQMDAGLFTDFAKPSKLREVAFDFVLELERRGRTAEVLTRMAEQYPHEPQFRELLQTLATSESLSPPSPARVSVTRLRHSADRLVGREGELAWLDDAWAEPGVHVATIVAFGGVGKTSLVFEWVARKAYSQWAGFDYVFDWSFYSQGTSDQSMASSDAFLDAALRFFGAAATADSNASSWDKASRLAELVGHTRTLLVLDGLEPLQHPPGPLGGKLRDGGMETLLKRLARFSHGLCVVTTRERVEDLSGYERTTCRRLDLDNLSEESGAALLYHTGATRAGAARIRSDDKELRRASREVDGHALTLRLIGQYLKLAKGGDIRKRDTVAFEVADRRYGHAFRAVAQYEAWLGTGDTDNLRQLAVLRLLGLFDRPASAACLKALRAAPTIPGLTDPLVGLGEDDWNIVVSDLANLDVRAGEDGSLDAHPLLREYFASQLRTHAPAAWRAGHQRLFEHLTIAARYNPDTFAGLLPLYQAVAHGCQAELYEQARTKVYRDRILRDTFGGASFYSTSKLGAFGADLGAVACFFARPWSTPEPSLSPAAQAWVLGIAAFNLRALGRLGEAVEPMRAGFKAAVALGIWYNAAGAINLSGLELTRGAVCEALTFGEQAVDYAERSRDSYWPIAARATHARVLHCTGQWAAAQELFEEAERLQAKYQPHYPQLYSAGGFSYREFLLTETERAAWRAFARVTDLGGEHLGALDAAAGRANAVFAWRKLPQWLPDADPPLSVGLDHLTLARTALYRRLLAPLSSGDLPNPRDHIKAAVDHLRASGQLDHLPNALLTRSWVRAVLDDAASSRGDLDEAWEVAERGGMRLHLADIHLCRARLFFRVTPYPWESPAADLAAARALIEETGYHRRDGELTDAEEMLRQNP